MGSCGVQLQPLVDAMKAELLQHRVLHADETPVAMLKPGNGKTHRAYLWAYATGAFENTKVVVYEYEGTSHFRATASECQNWRVGSQSQPLWKGKSHEESSYTPDTTYLVNLAAGRYLVEYEYWSSNTRDAVAYSPALLSFGSLAQLRNGVYSSNENTTAFYRASFAADSTVSFSGQGVYIAVLRPDMSFAYNIGSSYSPLTLPAGDYVFHLKFSSNVARSVSITSPALPS